MNRFITILLLVLSAATASAQKAADWRDLLTIVDDNNRTVYYERESHKPLKGEYRIKRGLDIEFVKLKDGVIDGDYRRYRNGELRESGKYVKGKREGEFTEYHSGGISGWRKDRTMDRAQLRSRNCIYIVAWRRRRING